MADLAFEMSYDASVDVCTYSIFKKNQQSKPSITYGINIDDVLILKVDVNTKELKAIEILGICENKVNITFAFNIIQNTIEKSAGSDIDWEKVFYQAVQADSNLMYA